MATTLLTLIQNVARAGYGYISVTPSGAGNAGKTTIVSDAAGSQLDPDDTARLMESAWVKCESDSAGTPLNVGEVRRLDSETGYTPSSGTLTVTRAFSNATTTTQGFGVYAGIPPDNMGFQRGIKHYINQVLRRLFYHRQFLLTLVTDGDMEASGVTNWTATNSTRTKSTSTGVTLGKQALRVANSAANGYVQSATVTVEPNEVYLVAADVTISSGTAILRLWDVTNGASIDSETCQELQARRLWFLADLPSTCRQVAVRLEGTEQTADIYWDNVSLINVTAQEMSLPSWFDNAQWLEWIRAWRPGNTSAANNDRALDNIRREPGIEFDVIEDREGVTPFKVRYDFTLPQDALLVGQALSPYTELSADSDSTEANADLVQAWALVDIYTDKGDEKEAAKWLVRAQELEGKYPVEWEGRRYKVRWS